MEILEAFVCPNQKPDGQMCNNTCCVFNVVEGAEHDADEPLGEPTKVEQQLGTDALAISTENGPK